MRLLSIIYLLLTSMYEDKMAKNEPEMAFI